jgi:hypothetical protein
MPAGLRFARPDLGAADGGAAGVAAGTAPLPLEAALVDALDRAASCSNNAAARNNAVARPHS